MNEHDLFEWVSVVGVPVLVAFVGFFVNRKAKARIEGLSEQNTTQHAEGRALVSHLSEQLNNMDSSLHVRFDRVEDRLQVHDDRLLEVEMKIIHDQVGQLAPTGDEVLPTAQGLVQLDFPLGGPSGPDGS